MKARFLSWWSTRTLREQRMLLALALVAALVLSWLIVLRPLNDALATAKAQHNQAVIALAETRASAEAIRALGRSGTPAASAPVATLVSQAATEAGFSITRLDSDGAGGVTLVMAAARPQAFFAWLAELERQGIRVGALTASTNTDQTLSVQVSFPARGA